MLGKRIPILLTAIVAVAASATWAAPAARPAADPLDVLAANAGGRIAVHFADETGAPDFIRAYPGALIARDGGKGSPEVRARRFLSTYGAAIGMSPAERRVAAPGATPSGTASALRLTGVERDATGRFDVRFAQTNRGRDVYAAQVLVHLSPRGVTGVNGHFVSAIDGAPNAGVTDTDARAIALTAVAKEADRSSLRVASTSLRWFRTGLIQGTAGATRLAWAVEIEGGPSGREHVWVDAQDRAVLLREPLQAHAKDRVVYSPIYDRKNPDRFVVRSEGDPPTYIPTADNLYEFTGQVYDFFANGFGRDSYDGKGETMRTVALVNNVCPNAYWNGATTNYCPGFDLDDVVAHEWGHAYTEYTHGLIYMCQSGALNESYSDIWGEAIDLTNDMDGVGGAVNDTPYPDGQRWLVGEDLTEPVHEVLLRDMWDPERLGDPAKVSSAVYVCANSSDNGGVHTNSGIPNHAFAMLVDGKTFNGHTVRAIGMTKAAHIYWRAMVAYQHPTIKFAGHEQALLAACGDLQGVNLRSPFTGAPSGERIAAGDCAQVATAMKAVEMSKPPSQCQFSPILAKGEPVLCPGATTLFAERFEGGLGGWELSGAGTTEDWPGTEWAATAQTPQGHGTRVAYAKDADVGTCETGNDASGSFAMTSKPIAIPASAENARLRFTHYVATESDDGGNVMASVDDGEFTPLPAPAYLFNPPPGAIPAPLPGSTNNDNPKAGEPGWFGTDGGESKGSWGVSIADLSAIAQPGQTIRLRFDFGLDCGGGYDGWYIDDVLVYDCPVLPSPAAVTVPEAPVTGPFTVSWTRPAGATGPDTLEESAVSCAPLLADDAESGLALWDTAVEGTGAQAWTTDANKPEHDGTAFAVRGTEGMSGTTSDLIVKEPIALPRSGTATLAFRDWFIHEGDDSVRVDVSRDAGKTWKAVYTNGRSDYAPLQLAAFATEPLTPRTADLTPFMGSSILLRFRFAQGPDNRAGSIPFGWYVDDIAVAADSWTPVATTTATSYRVARHAAGAACFRVRSTYRVAGAPAPGLWSAPSATVTVSKAFGSVVQGIRRTTPGGPLPATGTGDGFAGGAGLLIAAAALAIYRRRAAA